MAILAVTQIQDTLCKWQDWLPVLMVPAARETDLRAAGDFQLQCKARKRLIGRNTLIGPTTCLIIFRQHLDEAAGQSLGGTGLGRIFQQALGQGVIGTGKARGNVVHALHVPDALAHFHEVFGRPVTVTGTVDLGRDVVCAQCEGGEDAGTARIHGSRDTMARRTASSSRRSGAATRTLPVGG